MIYHSELRAAELGTAIQHHRSGRLDDAERIYRQILSVDANHADSLHLLGMIVYSRGNHAAAVDMIRRAIRLDPTEPSYRSNLGNVLKDQGQLDAAIAAYRQAIFLKPDYAEAHNNLGIALADQGRMAEAIESYGRAITFNPGCAEAFSNLGQAFQAQDDMTAALASYELALALQPGFADAHYNLGNALQGQGEFEAAIASYQRALAIKPAFAEAYCNLGNTLKALNRIEDALAAYQQALKLKPDFALARYGSALCSLMQEDFSAGWSGYEWRWQISRQQAMRVYPQPFWNGEPLGSGRLLLWHEQGVGDEIMFAGLIPDVLRAGHRCVVDCDPRLKPLFSRSFPDVEVVSGFEVNETGFAAHLPLGSLPRFFRPDIPAFTAATSPYLVPDLEKKEQFRTRYYAGKRVIGLAWYTNNKDTGRSRSIDLSLFDPLFARQDIAWVSLQYGDQAVRAPILVDQSLDQLLNLDGFAAQIAAMDLVITIDNSTAHLAGALGVPVWLLLPFAADWRWFRERGNSPWYPSMRIFRQQTPGDWTPVVESLRRIL